MLLVYVLAFVVLVNCIFYLIFSRFSFASSGSLATTSTFPVSVIVCAKNEAENLKNNIPRWLDQDYSNFELILINDASHDDTLIVMQDFEAKDHRIKVVDVVNNEAFWGNKKYALTLGIKKAANQRMLFTDADCHPASNKWIKEMVAPFSKEKQLILGYGGYLKKPGLLNAIIRYETLITAVQYLSFAEAGMPYMGVGRNLAYTSKLFYENKGFTSHMNVLSGDDDLFVQEAATAANTAIVTTPESFTYSLPKNSWKAWFHQKKRHSSTSKYYKPKFKLLLGALYLFNLLFWIIAAFGLCSDNWDHILIVMAIRFVAQFAVVGSAAIKLKEAGLLFFLPLLELFLVSVQLSIFISGSRSKNRHWK